MKSKKLISVALSALFLVPSLAFLGGCGTRNETVLRVYNWEEYIDEGGEDSYAYDPIENPNAPSIIDDFESWFEETYNAPIRVEYSTFGTNEDLYNQLKLGNSYDLVCPSEYMIMKLAAENMLQPLNDAEDPDDVDFFDQTNELNYYANHVSPFIAEVFENGTVEVEGTTRRWSEYAAGYMWGTTGFIYNPELVSAEALDQGWAIMLDKNFRKRVTTKDNVRDSYFVGLAILYRQELLDLDREDPEYNKKVTEIMNRTDEETISKVQNILLEMKENIFGFETDTGKADMVKGTIALNFSWSGDAVYAINLAEEENDMKLHFHIPEESANLFFDGWVMPKGANRKAAKAFINFLSKPENAVRNMDYIGYSSVIAGEEVFEYVQETYETEEDDESAAEYDLSYFFGEGAVISAAADQLDRQLFAQYPPQEVMQRCAVMDYYGKDDALINELWTKVKGETLDGWAIAVICVAVLSIAVFVLIVKFGGKIDLFRRKPKKGYTLVKQEAYRPIK
jgi:spermidine/putrescine transport system substrate-binding protein